MDKPTVGMCVRRGGARLRAMGKAHTPLHVMLWQAREAQNALLAAATAQKTLFSDIAAWASTENQALNDVCSCASELSSLYSAAQVQIALAYKSFRKDMTLILEGEKRCDLAQKKLQDADERRLKLRRQVLRAQNKRLINGENPRRSGDFTSMQTQLSEAERTADRLHMEACDATREQEAVKLVVVRSALAKLSESHLALSNQAKLIFEGEREITHELPEPPPPGDPLSSMRYTGHEATRTIVERVKSQVQLQLVSSPTNPNYVSPERHGGISAITTTTSPNPASSSWTPTPSAPMQVFSESAMDPPPPYNASFFSSTPASGEDMYDGCNIDSGHGRRPRRNGRHITSGNRARRPLYNNTSTVSPVTSATTTDGQSNYNRTSLSPPGNPFEVPDDDEEHDSSGTSRRY